MVWIQFWTQRHHSWPVEKKNGGNVSFSDSRLCNCSCSPAQSPYSLSFFSDGIRRCPRSHKVSLGLTRSQKVSQGLTRVRKVSQGPTRSHKVSQGLTRSHKIALEGFTRSHKILQGPSRSHKDQRDQFC